MPWSNRIQDARYSFDGVEYDFGPDEYGMRSALHGLAYMRDWEILHFTDSSVTLAITVGGIDAYPFRIALKVTYRLDGPNLFMEMEATNQGEKAAPVGMGWHPYFAHEGDWTVTLPARQKVLVDEQLNPLPEPFVEVEEPVVLHSAENVDTAYTALSSNTAKINNGTYDIEMTYTGLRQQAGVGVFHVYTGEGMSVRPGQSVAVEPCEFIADAYNRPELAEALRLEPAHSRMFTVQLTVSAPSGEVAR
ncbi:hypothetical protein BM477_01705 [Boudabousia marimammalium]|uniref:Aldose epimerase n=1 Tax=Boudabousia marimammalium TaxID=156892 RepID=A0A1Q5PRV2_9ACTO|nr:hypothetical protein BM477_01705 [Boudabousia marimammalium]